MTLSTVNVKKKKLWKFARLKLLTIFLLKLKLLTANKELNNFVAERNLAFLRGMRLRI